MDGRVRENLKPGSNVDIVLKADQQTGKLTRGVVQKILTNSRYHPRGQKVLLQSGHIGRVQKIIDDIIENEAE